MEKTELSDGTGSTELDTGEKYQQEEKYRQALMGDALVSYEIDIDNDMIIEKIIEKKKDMLPRSACRSTANIHSF